MTAKMQQKRIFSPNLTVYRYTSDDYLLGQTQTVEPSAAL